MNTHERIQYLASSTNRVRILRVCRDHPSRPSELVDRCSVARSTIHRNLNDLGDLGWVRRENGHYRTTDTGALVLERYDDLYRTIERVDKAEPFRVCFERDEVEFPLEGLDTAVVREGTAANPHAALHYYTENIPDSVGQFRGVSPVVSPIFNDAYRDLLPTATRSELIIDEGVLATSQDAYADTFDRALSFDLLEIYVHPRDLAFGVAIFDEERTFVSAYDDQSRLRAVLDSTDDGLLEWATDVYETRREASTSLETVLSNE